MLVSYIYLIFNGGFMEQYVYNYYLDIYSKLTCESKSKNFKLFLSVLIFQFLLLFLIIGDFYILFFMDLKPLISSIYMIALTVVVLILSYIFHNVLSKYFIKNYIKSFFEKYPNQKIELPYDKLFLNKLYYQKKIFENNILKIKLYNHLKSKYNLDLKNNDHYQFLYNKLLNLVKEKNSNFYDSYLEMSTSLKKIFNTSSLIFSLLIVNIFKLQINIKITDYISICLIIILLILFVYTIDSFFKGISNLLNLKSKKELNELLNLIEEINIGI